MIIRSHLFTFVEKEDPMTNPFITSGYAGEAFFCDRKQETASIREFLINGNNLALISPRRLGKTELLCHVFDDAQLRRQYHCFLVDIYSTKNLTDFVSLLGKAVVDELRSKGKAAWNKFINIVGSLRAEISFDDEGKPVWGIGLKGLRNPSLTLDEIFQYLDNADKPCFVAIDEFQQITRYGDDTVEALLRTYIQRCTRVHFVFSGSQRHLMGEMFTSPARPFYQSVIVINLQPLDREVYTDFCVRLFEENGRHLERAVVSSLYERFEAVTSYMHRVMNVLYAWTAPGETCRADSIDEAVEYLLRLSSDTYENLLYQMPEKQRALFLAIASDGKASGLTGGPFLRRHGIATASSVQSALIGLLEKDFITMDRNVYSACDGFFVLWLKFKGLIP